MASFVDRGPGRLARGGAGGGEIAKIMAELIIGL